MNSDRNTTTRSRLSSLIGEFEPRPAFSCLFGSLARGEERALSDVDVGVYYPGQVSLAVLSRLSADLEEAAGRGVDVVELAGLWMRRPALAYRIATEMQPLTIDDEEALVRFRTRSFLEYIETEPLRRRAQDSLRRRLAAGRAGYRNYVG